MTSFFLSLSVFLLASFFPLAHAKTSVAPPSIPDSGTTSKDQVAAPVPSPLPHAAPARLIIPSLSIDTRIVGVGVDKSGAMAVPDGDTKNVGWYEGGVVPGNVGSAVFDAHVFAAFMALHNIKVGADIYVVTADGEKLHFVVQTKKTYALASLSSSQLFVPTDERDLNLITCAGKLTPDHSTYDHRLIVYATLVK